MSLVVKLEDDLGERSEWVMLHGVIPGREEREFQVLRGIDPYGKTVFNHLQMEMFLAEWERVRERAHVPKPELEESLETVVSLGPLGRPLQRSPALLPGCGTRRRRRSPTRTRGCR